MRTKTLLMALAVTAAGVLASKAQPVYSANIVGYANVVIPGGNAFTLMVVPIGASSTNTAESTITSVSVGDNVLIWTGTGYIGYTYAGVNGGGPGLNWYDSDFNGVASPILNPGQAFFYQNGGATKTNTFVGTVQLTNTVIIPGGNAFSLIGTTPPIAGGIDSTNFNMPLHVGDNVLIWTGAGYTGYTYAGVNGGGPGLNWYDSDFNGITGPNISVGQGFFYQNGGASATWTNNIVVQ